MEIANSMRPPFAHPLTSLLLLTNVLSKKLVLSPAGLRGSKLRESRESGWICSVSLLCYSKLQSSEGPTKLHLQQWRIYVVSDQDGVCLPTVQMSDKHLDHPLTWKQLPIQTNQATASQFNYDWSCKEGSNHKPSDLISLSVVWKTPLWPSVWALCLQMSVGQVGRRCPFSFYDCIDRPSLFNQTSQHVLRAFRKDQTGPPGILCFHGGQQKFWL